MIQKYFHIDNINKPLFIIYNVSVLYWTIKLIYAILYLFVIFLRLYVVNKINNFDSECLFLEEKEVSHFVVKAH